MTIQELEEQVKVLQEEIEKMKVAEKEQKRSKWKPKVSEMYWYVSDCGTITNCHWYNDSADIWRYHNIPIFQTKKECVQYNKFREDVLAHRYEFSEEEWENGDIPKYYIMFDSSYDTIHSDYHYYGKYFNQIYFKTEEDAEYIIDNYSEELKKWRI